MAGDLIPPPSPAGKPEGDWDKEPTKGPFSESELLRTDAEHDALREPEPIAPVAASPYRSRFGFILGALVGVGVAAMVIIALVVMSNDNVREPAWSAWKPTSGDPDVAAVQVAQHVAHEYRLNSGDQLVDVYAQRLELDGTPLNVVIRSTGKGEGADIIDIPGKSLLFVLKGLGPRGSIDSEEASEKRLRLVQREAYELSLYAFKYVKGIDNVVAFLPPPPPSDEQKAADAADRQKRPLQKGQPAGTLASGAASIAAAQGQPVPAMLFLPGDVRASLERPLTATFPDGEPPRPATITTAEADVFGAFAQVHGFTASVVPDQTGAGFLVLDRASTSAAAEKALAAALKA
ncbi:MAG: hypothetical protein QOI80_1419 [Solirubrobacteraceae bacterium]|jgi:hypothetical protein|nr:hypothetical protein [Solirubrobacteraceae bacterium]